RRQRARHRGADRALARGRVHPLRAGPGGAEACRGRLVKKLLAVAVKEMRQIRRDPLSLLMLLGLPAFLLVLYGFALNFDVRHVALAVQDRDRTAQSRALVDAFVRSTYFDLVATPPPGTRLEDLTERGRAQAILVIPERYGQDLAGGRSAEVQ